MTIREDIAKVYVGYFGRSPEPEGFNYWISESNRGFTALETAASFSVQQESTDRYPYLKNPNVADPVPFVTSVYQNLFNRDPDQEGLDFWVNELNEAQGNPDAVGAMVLNIISGAQNTEEFGPDLDIITNKVAVALDWAESTAELSSFAYELGSEAAASAKSVLDDVDETQASVDAAKAETDAFIASGAGQPVNTITLTNGIDSGPAFTGTEGADQFNGTAQTFNTGDDLDGGGGNDTLSVQFGNFQSVSATPRLTDIENIEVQGGARDLNALIDLTTSTGVEKLMLQNVSGEATQAGNFGSFVVFDGVNGVVDLAVADSSTPDETFSAPPLTNLTVNYTASAIAGDADLQKLAISNSSLDTFSVAGVEAIEITAEGRNFITEVNQVNTMRVDGSGDLVAGFTAPPVAGTGETANFDSTASTGNMAISFANSQDVVARAGEGDDNFDLAGTSVVDVDGGGGDDIFFMDGGQFELTANDMIEGGAGKDTLAISTLANTSAAQVNATSGMEVLRFQQQNDSMAASDFTDIDEFIFNGADGNRRTTINSVESDDLFVFTADRSASDQAVRFEGANVGETLTMELRAQDVGSLTKDFQTVTKGNVDITTNGGTGNDTSAVFLSTNISSVTIVSSGNNGDGVSANAINAVDTGFKHYAFNNDAGTGSFNIVGEKDLTIATGFTVDQSANSDILGFSQSANVNASEFTGDLRIAMSNSGDVFVGGSGDDVVYGRGGNDRLTGSDGADQFRFSGDNGTDVILDFLIGEDKVGLSEVDFMTTDAGVFSFSSAELAAEDYVENRDGIDNIGSADAFSLLELQSGLSAGQIANDTGAAVNAYILVFNETSNKGEIWHDNDWSNAGNRDHVATFDNVVDLAGVQAFSNSDFVEFIA